MIPLITTKKFFTVPYINTISNQFKTTAKKNNFKIAYKPINSRFIKLGKDRLYNIEKMEQCDVLYKISCLNCDFFYVSQIKRKIKTLNQRTQKKRI